MIIRCPIILLAVAVAVGHCSISAQTRSLELQLQECSRTTSGLRADWAGLGHYRDRNVSLPLPKTNENRVVFIGDSITDQWEFDEYFPGKSYINRGISAQTSGQMLIRFRADVIDLKPKAVVILAGTNDLPAVFKGAITTTAITNNLASMAELARANHIRVVIASITPASNRTVNRPPERIKLINGLIRKYTAENHMTYLDYWSALADSNGYMNPDLTSDGLHLNAKGYDVMKVLAEKAIAAALRKK